VNRIEELIQQLCPDGVEWKTLGEIGYLYGGLSGKTKSDFQDGNARFISYMNVYSNISVRTDILDFVKVDKNENQNRIQLGDVLFTGSSETPNECGMSSVLTEVVPEPLYLNSFCFGFRLNNNNLFLPHFLKYLFRSDQVRKEIGLTASGVTRFNISKKRFEKIPIPIPPLAIQNEIVNILDLFTRLEAELEAELEARKIQYTYYRDSLLNFEGKGVEWKTLGDVCKSVSSGGTPLANKKEYYSNGTIPWLRTQEVRFNEIFDTEVKITELALKESSAKWIPANCVIIAISGATAARSAINRIPLTTNQHCCCLNIDAKKASYRFVYHWVSCKYEQLKSLGQGARSDLNSGRIKSFPIPVPPLSEQERIVGILDKFDALVNDLSSGLPAEIKARRQQYEYYRDQLLTFKNRDHG
jgi:type I restriction enzyme S subunit